MYAICPLISLYYVSAFQSWLKEYELKHKCEYILNTGKKLCRDGHRSYYECCRTGVHEGIENSKRAIKSQGSKKININCTSHIILFEPFDKGNCTAIFYKEHYGHKENELQHIHLTVEKKKEIATKLSQGVTMKKILDDFKNNIETNVKRENLITRADIYNIKQKYKIKVPESKLCKGDKTNIGVCIEKIQQEGENNPVVYYKRQGKYNVTIINLNNFIRVEICS